MYNFVFSVSPWMIDGFIKTKIVITSHWISDFLIVAISYAQRSGCAAPATKVSGNMARCPRRPHEPVVRLVVFVQLSPTGLGIC